MDEMEPEFVENESGQCLFNKGVVCTEKECYACGWNPKVAEARREKIREALCGE